MDEKITKLLEDLAKGRLGAHDEGLQTQMAEEDKVDS